MKHLAKLLIWLKVHYVTFFVLFKINLIIFSVSILDLMGWFCLEIAYMRHLPVVISVNREKLLQLH